MSRREGRESDTRRSHSRIEREREPSPKRSRRDGKPKTERNTSRNYDVDTLQDNGQDQKLRRRLQDALPLEAPLEPESKVESESAKSELKKKSDEKESDVTKDSSNPTEVPRSRSYFQHDERGIAGQGGRSFSRRATTDRRWSDTKDKSSEKRGGDEVDVKNARKREERTQARGDENNVWHHDRFHEVEADATRSARKRPAFRETKVEQESGNTTASTATESGKPSRHEEPVSENSRREERGGRRPYESDRFKRPFTGDRVPLHRRDSQRVDFSSRERFGGGGGSMGRGRFSGRYEERNQNNIIRGEKWKHDMFHEANKSPSPKTAEDEIAKVEALLAS